LYLAGIICDNESTTNTLYHWATASGIRQHILLNQVKKIVKALDGKLIPTSIASPHSLITISRGISRTTRLRSDDSSVYVARGASGSIYTKMLGTCQVAIKQQRYHEFAIKELAIMSSLSHPNVQNIINFSIEKDIVYFSMPLAGGTLHDEIYSAHTFSEAMGCATTVWTNTAGDRGFNFAPILLARRRGFARQLLQGLAYIHASGIIHGDIKPKNLLVFGDTLKIADFGLSIVDNHSIITPRSPTISTLYYRDINLLVASMMRNGDGSVLFSFEIDIWSAAVTMMEMEMGCVPFHGSNEMITAASVISVMATGLRCVQDLRLRNLLLQMLKYDTTQRITAIRAAQTPL